MRFVKCSRIVRCVEAREGLSRFRMGTSRASFPAEGNCLWERNEPARRGHLAGPGSRTLSPRLLLLRGCRSLCAGEDSFDRSTTLFFTCGIGQRLAGNHLVALSCVVYEDRFDGCDLFQVGWLETLHYILVGVMVAALIIQIILNELEARNSNRIETQVIGSAGVPHRKCGNAKIFERRDPLRKDGRDGSVALEVDSANLSRAVVDIEVSGNQLLFGLDLKRPRGPAHELWQRYLIGRG